jgi:predicted metalloprotease
MRWTPGKRSENLEDRRGAGGGRLALGGRGLGIGGILILLVLSVVFRQDFLGLLSGGGTGVGAADASAPVTDQAEEPLVQFVSFVLDDAQATWAQVLASTGVTYHDARLVLYRDAIQSACGFAQSATGPFYCPGDEKVYVDLGFYQELRDRFGAPGDFAQAYVLAHEIGHHVQHLLGTDAQVRQAQRARGDLANALSVRLELQADCYAGIWAHTTEQRGLLERGDVEEGLQAAASVGDDRLQRMGGGTVNPDAFTHGSSAERVAWFRKGLAGGRLAACDTFAGGI